MGEESHDVRSDQSRKNTEASGSRGWLSPVRSSRARGLGSGAQDDVECLPHVLQGVHEASRQGATSLADGGATGQQDDPSGSGMDSFTERGTLGHWMERNERRRSAGTRFLSSDSPRPRGRRSQSGRTIPPASVATTNGIESNLPSKPSDSWRAVQTSNFASVQGRLRGPR